MPSHLLQYKYHGTFPFQPTKRRALISAFLNHNTIKSIIPSLISGSVNRPFRLPQSFFKLQVLFHQFGEHFVFCLKFLLKGQYFLFLRTILDLFYTIKYPCFLFKKLLLPSIKHRRLQLVLFAKTGNRNFPLQMLPYDVYFFIYCIVASFLSIFFSYLSYQIKTISIQGNSNSR